MQHSQSGTPYSLRYAGDPTGTTLNQCSPRGCQVTRPGARNTERAPFINYTDVTLARTFQIGGDRLEFRADAFNVFNNWNLTADGYGRHPRRGQLRQAHRRLRRVPGPAVPVRGHLPVLALAA